MAAFGWSWPGRFVHSPREGNYTETSNKPGALSVERQADLWKISLGRTFGLGSAAELRAVLLEFLAAGVSLQLDLRQCAVTVPLLQMLWSARQETKKRGFQITAFASDEAVQVIRGAGFDQFFENPPLINL